MTALQRGVLAVVLNPAGRAGPSMRDIVATIIFCHMHQRHGSLRDRPLEQRRGLRNAWQEGTMEVSDDSVPP